MVWWSLHSKSTLSSWKTSPKSLHKMWKTFNLCFPPISQLEKKDTKPKQYCVVPFQILCPDPPQFCQMIQRWDEVLQRSLLCSSARLNCGLADALWPGSASCHLGRVHRTPRSSLQWFFTFLRNLWDKIPKSGCSVCVQKLSPSVSLTLWKLNSFLCCSVFSVQWLFDGENLTFISQLHTSPLPAAGYSTTIPSKPLDNQLVHFHHHHRHHHHQHHHHHRPHHQHYHHQHYYHSCWLLKDYPFNPLTVNSSHNHSFLICFKSLKLKVASRVKKKNIPPTK